MSPEAGGLIAEFDTADALRQAVDAALADGYRRLEAFAPFPMGDIAERLGTRASWLPWLAWGAGAVGAAIQFGAQFWMNAVDYPINVGGRPLNSWPAFLPSTLIVAILWAGAATLLGIYVILRLPRLDHPLFAVPGFERASQDRFFLVIKADDPAFSTARAFLQALRPLSLHEVPCR